MALKPVAMWNKVKSDLKGKSQAEQREILRNYLSDWPQYDGEYARMKRQLKTKLEALERRARTAGREASRYQSPFIIKKVGAHLATIAGVANSGKSQLYRSITDAETEVAPFPFSTLYPHWTVVHHHNVAIQVIDLPPVEHLQSLEGTASRQLNQCLALSDLFFLTLDMTCDTRSQGDTIADWLRTLFSEGPLPPCMVIATKGSADQLHVASQELGSLSAVERITIVPTTATGELCLEHALRQIGYIKVFSKSPKNKLAEKEPLFIPAGSTVIDAAAAIHKELATSMRSAKIWPNSGDGPTRVVKPSQVLRENDVIEVQATKIR